MELTPMLLLVAVVLFYFRRVLLKSAVLIENTVEVFTETSEDTLQTYANDISISNAKKRSSQADELERIASKGIYTNKDIENILTTMSSEYKPKKKKKKSKKVVKDEAA